jgi:hypothetical protein
MGGIGCSRRFTGAARASAWRAPLLAITLVLARYATPAHAAVNEPAVRVLELHGASIRVVLPERPVHAGEEAILEWIASAARAVAAYEGTFPVRSATVRIGTHGGRGVGRGTARFAGTPEIRVSVGEDTERDDLRRDWVMTHEMIHLGFPSVGGPHAWMEEGLATYVEPIARARVGACPAEEAWGKLGVFLPKGLPKEGDQGLDLSSTGGRTYWGGAVFWLVADVEIRRGTHCRRGLEDVVRAIVSAGGTIGQSWTADRVIAVGDRAAGAPVLRRLYARMATSPDRVDLGVLWRALGVACENGRVVLDDSAPLAPVRRAITMAEAPAARASSAGPRHVTR